MTDLARELGQIAPWVRLHYVYPYPHVDAVVPLMADGLVLPYLDIPFQHASPNVLKAMKRPANDAKVLSVYTHVLPDTSRVEVTLKINREDAQKGDMRDTYADTSLARADLAFTPKVTLDEGIQAEYRWLSSLPVSA
jgi:hypothetical protein